MFVYSRVFGILSYYSGTLTVTGLFNRGAHPGTATVYPAPAPVRAGVPEKGELVSMFLHVGRLSYITPYQCSLSYCSQTCMLTSPKHGDPKSFFVALDRVPDCAVSICSNFYLL